MTHRLAGPARDLATGAVLACGAGLLVAASWAGDRSGAVGGMEATGYGFAAVFLLLAGVPTLLLGGLALLLRRRPVAAGTACALAGLLVLVGGGAAAGTVASPAYVPAMVVGGVVTALGLAAAALGSRAPR